MCELTIELKDYNTLLNSMYYVINFLEYYHITYAQFSAYDYEPIPHNFIELPNYNITIIFELGR